MKPIASVHLLLIGMLLTSTSQMPAASAQSLKYRPRVGEPFVYGIDCLVMSTASRNPPREHRVRLTVTPTAVEADQWQVEYATVPVYTSGPAYQLRRMPEHRIPPRLPGEPDDMYERRIMLDKNMIRRNEVLKLDQQLMPGLMTPEKGTLTLGYDGRCKDSSTITNMPLMLGPVWSVPLAILPSDDSQASYSDKQLLVWTGNESDRRLPEAWLINSWSVEDKKDVRVKLKRSLEFSAEGFSVGDSDTIKLDLSGDGEVQFNSELGLTLSGKFLFKSNQSLYGGAIAGHEMQVAFQLLNQWQQRLFDQYLVPNEFALEKQYLRRLSPKQVSSWLSWLNNPEGQASELWLKVPDLGIYAPPPMDSRLYQLMQQKVKSTESKKDGLSDFDQIRVLEVLNRWERVRELGTIVPRTWKASAGSHQIKARMVSADEQAVLLQRVDNDQQIKVPLEKLSADDQEFVSIFGKKPAES